MYEITIVQECVSLSLYGTTFEGLPFVRLWAYDVLTVLSQSGHLNIIQELECIVVGEGGDDCLLIVRNGVGDECL